MKHDIIKMPAEGRSLYDELIAKGLDEDAALEVVAQKLGESTLVTAYYIGLKDPDGMVNPMSLSKNHSCGFLITELPDDTAILLSCEEEIVKNYKIVQDGVKAWFRMGFALARAKSIISHGHFQKWRNTTFPDMGRSHLSNAQRVAEKIIHDSGTSPYELTFNGLWEHIISSTIELYSGLSQHQLILATVSNRPLTLAEEEHKKWVLAKFEERPKWADEYMPLIEIGERTWTQVMMALMGREQAVNENGNRRQTEPYLAFYRHIQTLPGSAKTLGSWDKIPADVQGKIIDSIRETIKFIPPGARHLLLPNDIVETEVSVTSKS